MKCLSGHTADIESPAVGRMWQPTVNIPDAFEQALEKVSFPEINKTTFISKFETQNAGPSLIHRSTRISNGGVERFTILLLFTIYLFVYIIIAFFSSY